MTGYEVSGRVENLPLAHGVPWSVCTVNDPTLENQVPEVRMLGSEGGDEETRPCFDRDTG